MKNLTYLIIDLGTGNTKVALISSSKEVLAIDSFENVYYKDESYSDAQYFLPNEWKDKIFKSCQTLLKNIDSPIHAIITTGARQSIVLYEDQNSFLGLPNIDNRGVESIQKIKEGKFIYEKSGKWLTADFPAAKLIGLKEKKINSYKRITSFSSISEWVGELFTGNISIEHTQACETQLYDIERKDWSHELCKIYNIEMSILPNLIKSGEVLGAVQNSIFPKLKGIPFIIGGADTQVALKSNDFCLEEIAIISGTTSPIVYLTEEKFYDESERCWVGVGLAGNNYQIETNPGVTGLNYQRFKNSFLKGISYEEIEKNFKVKQSYNTVASFSTLNFDKKSTSRRGGFFISPPLMPDMDVFDFLWSIQADIACSVYYQYKRLILLANISTDYIKAYGGGFQSKNLCQMIADLTSKELHLAPGYEQASLMGCVNICNEYFNIPLEISCKEQQIFYPKKGKLIKEYFFEWISNKALLEKK